MSQKTAVQPIGITMGCPAGIGAEIILKFWHDSGGTAPVVVIGDIGILEQNARLLGLAPRLHRWTAGAVPEPGCLNVLAVSDLNTALVRPGRPTRETGTAMAAYIEQAITLCRQGWLSAVTTCPISKSSLNQAGYDFPGHTEFLAARTGAKQVVMMMAGSKLRVTLATIHRPLAEVPGALSQAGLVALIRLTHEALRNDFNLAEPRLAVAGLNPHAGEDLLFGCEEQTVIAPAIAEAAAAGIRAAGPFPADTVFYRAAAGDFDAVVCMYHDQGLIPFKLLHFSDGVNVSLGLPIVRTSVDHGTAYDIAGTGRADFLSLKAAVAMAAMIARNRRKATDS